MTDIYLTISLDTHNGGWHTSEFAEIIAVSSDITAGYVKKSLVSKIQKILML